MKNDEIKLSREQKMAVDFEGKDLLVSAAAGSGKTAVLVERILHRIKGCPDEKGIRTKEPEDIDRFLIVTFTRAAAAQMKEKIENKLDMLLKDEGLDEEMRRHLEQQTVLVHHAQISTLHSFCSRVVKEHFQEVNLDVSYRMGDETEMLLMKNDIAGSVIERAYERSAKENDGAFYHFVENYCTGKNDSVLEDIILELYEKVMSHPWQREWLNNASERKNTDSLIGLMLEMAGNWIEPMYDSCKKALEECPAEYEQALQSDMTGFFKPLADALGVFIGGSKLVELSPADLSDDFKPVKDTYTKVREIIVNNSWETLGRKKKDTDGKKADYVKSIRDSYKKQSEKLKDLFFSMEYEEILNEQKNEIPLLSVLRELLFDFMESFSEEKRKKRILDFNDLEHFALDILIDNENGGVPSKAAQEYRDSFLEIMIDEYQDSNEIQEVILKSISKDNLFMVGDVKQSIYRFRMARPELFEEKHRSFLPADKLSEENIADTKGCLIELSNNYRSRNLVLDSINEIFRGIMEKKVGNIDYTKDVELNYKGREFKEYNEFPGKTECIIGNCSDDDIGVEMEAHMVAQRIKEMIDGGETIIDENTGDFRPVFLSDIVILLRSMKDISNVFLRVLGQYGIEAVCETTEGYFQTEEIKTACNFLKVIDNPRQDIPLTAVMVSPVFGFFEQELALIKIGEPDLEWYSAVEIYGKEGENEELRRKCGAFIERLNGWREKSLYMTVSELLSFVLLDSGYMDIMTVKKGGRQRRENLKLLIEKAADFEKTSYYGLFQFNRYIEKILSYEVDYGEAPFGKDYGNMVTIMSIHKSKGLEFPVVFVSCLGKKFNNNETKSQILFHSELGLGTNFLNEALRLKKNTQKKKILSSVIKGEGIGEEIRILYVALTRAKERLVLTGCGKDIYKKAEKWCMAGNALIDVNSGQMGTLSYYDRLYAGNSLDFVMPVLYAMKGMEGQLEKDSETNCIGLGKEKEIDGQTLSGLGFELKNFVVSYRGVKKVISEEAKRQEEAKAYSEELFKLKENIKVEKDDKERLRNLLYLPENEFEGLSGKISVTEIKKMKMEFSVLSSAAPLEAPVPAFAGGKKKISGAHSGTVFHKIMQYLDYESLESDSTKKEIIDFIKELEGSGRLTKEEGEIFYKEGKDKVGGWKKIEGFLRSELFGRMKAAAGREELYREYPFVLGVPAGEIYSKTDVRESESEPLILVQGIIDAFFYEDGEVVLVDYKTDRVNPEKNGEDLIKKYKVQMEYYLKALQSGFGKRAKEALLYSFGLGREIRVDM